MRVASRRAGMDQRVMGHRVSVLISRPPGIDARKPSNTSRWHVAVVNKIPEAPSAIRRDVKSRAQPPVRTSGALFTFDGGPWPPRELDVTYNTTSGTVIRRSTLSNVITGNITNLRRVAANYN